MPATAEACLANSEIKACLPPRRLASARHSMASILAFVKARIDILEMNCRHGVSKDSDAYVNLCVNAALAIRTQVLSVKSLDADHVAKLLGEVEVGLPTAQFEIVLNAVQEGPATTTSWSVQPILMSDSAA